MKGERLNKKEKIKYGNLPIVQKGKIYKTEEKTKPTSRFLTAGLIIFIIILLMFCGYSMAKAIEEVVIKGNAQVAEPILVVENNPAIDITETQNSGEYTFKIKNYNEQDKITETDLKYYIEIISDADDSVKIELYQQENQIKLNNNKTEFIKISKNQKEEIEYKIKITYNDTNSFKDIIGKIQVKVHTEQEKA